MTPEEIGKIVSEAANRALAGGGSDRAAARAEAAIREDLQPVRPLAPAIVFTWELLALCAAAASASAAALGLAGWRALSGAQATPIFLALLALGGLAAAACAREMRPASGRSLGAAALLLATAVFPTIFALVFGGYETENLVRQGIPCLRAGLAVAIPTGLAFALVLRRGFVMDWSAAGLAAGTLAGLAGLGMLELHCPNLKAIHVMIWHAGVVVSGAALGFLAGRMAEVRRRG